VPPKERPFAAFVPRSFLTQAVRQQVVNRLTGAFLLTLVESLQLLPQQHSQVRRERTAPDNVMGTAGWEKGRNLTSVLQLSGAGVAAKHATDTLKRCDATINPLWQLQ
jgi:hypothetical protein